MFHIDIGFAYIWPVVFCLDSIMRLVYSPVAIIVLILFNYLFLYMLRNVDPNDWI